MYVIFLNFLVEKGHLKCCAAASGFETRCTDGVFHLGMFPPLRYGVQTRDPMWESW